MIELAWNGEDRATLDQLRPFPTLVMCLHLAQAFSNRGLGGRKHDFKDTERLVRRSIAKELILSFVPDGEQRIWRNLTRMKLQLVRDRVCLQSQIECLLEEMHIELSEVVSDLRGSRGLRILHAVAESETDAKNLASLGDDRLRHLSAPGFEISRATQSVPAMRSRVPDAE